MIRNPVGAARRAGVQIPPSPPNRRKRRIACGDFFKGTVYSFCCSLFLPGERFTDLPDEEIVCEAEISEWKPPEKGLLFDGR